MRALIVGEGKSGTTALFRSVAAALGDPAEVFEPDDLTTVDVRPDPLVAKKLLASWTPDEEPAVDAFDRRVLILRDPRDRLISHLLYDAFNQATNLNEAQRDRWLRVLERKVTYPEHVSLVWVMDAWWKLAKVDLLGGYFRALQRSNAFTATVGERFHTIRYEDYVDGEFDSLTQYLGVELEPGQVASRERRVKRSGGHGDWRTWFTDIDVHVFRPITERWLNRNGYERHDWELEPDPEIDTVTSLDYVRGLLQAGGPPRSD